MLLVEATLWLAGVVGAAVLFFIYVV